MSCVSIAMVGVYMSSLCGRIWITSFRFHERPFIGKIYIFIESHAVYTFITAKEMGKPTQAGDVCLK